ncbi:MAG: hypothetical protein ACI9LM_000578 [Alteromonadaceae bacterium]|jgi:hypothetical protein
MTLYSWFTQHANATSQDKTSSRKVSSIISVNSRNCSMWPVVLVRKNSTSKKYANKV